VSEGLGGPVLVTGGTGFLGLFVTRALVRAGHTVTLAGRHEVELPEGARRFVQTDGQQPGALVDVVETGAFRVVVHLAALARTGEAEADPARADRLNRDWPGELAAAARAGVRFVHASTDLVFGGEPPRGATGFGAADPPAPVGHYGVSKAAGEGRVRAADPHALVVRLPLLFGDSGGRGFGAGDGLFAALERGESPGLFTDELRTPLDVEAAAAALVALSDAHATGIWHLGGRPLSRFELGVALCHATGRDTTPLVPTTRVALGLTASRAGDARLDTRRTREHFPAIAALLDSGSAPSFPKS
jgi:dTDP-4-dehydrorhamnose reductase